MATPRFVGIAAVVVMALRVLCVSQAIAQTPASGELSGALEAANLSPEGKALLRAKGTEVVRAGVAESEVAGLIQRGVGRGVQPAELVRLLDVVAQAKRQDLPVGPVLDKVKEGLAKRVPPARIAAVTVRLSGELATSRDVVRRGEHNGIRGAASGARERATEAIADALGKGVPPKELEDLSRGIARSSERATMSRLQAGAQVTADLVSMGLSPRDATETVGAAVSRGLSQHDIERLRERFGQELKRGGSAENGAKRLREAIRSERPDDRGDRSPDRGSDKPEKMEKVEKMEKPEKPSKVERPGR
jgi:hypothetical protein